MATTLNSQALPNGCLESSSGVQVFDGLVWLPVLPANAREVEVATRQKTDGAIGTIVRPGVYVREIDFSKVAPQLDSDPDPNAPWFTPEGFRPPQRVEKLPRQVDSSEQIIEAFGEPKP